MKYSKPYRILTLAIILSLAILVISPIPVLAAESITLHPNNGLPGTEVRVDGVGFTAGHTIGIYFAGSSVAYETIISTTFSIYFDVPDDAEAGAYKVEVLDWDASPVQVVASAWFIVIGGQIELDPNRGPIDTEVEISGENFGDREDITIEYDGDEIEIESGDDRTDSDGEFSCFIIIPESSRGDHTITVKDDSGISAEAEFTVEPEITINPTSGSVGDEVAVSGTGFRASRSINITFDGDTVMTSPTSVRTNSKGSFSTSFDIPIGTKGTYEIEASDGTYEASTDFTVSIIVSISQTSGYVGTEIAVSGTGFRASRSINITFGDIQVETTTTDANGSFTSSFLVPGFASGAYEVGVSDGVNTDSADFTVLTSFSIIQTSSYVGTEIAVSGTGFRASRSINITFGDIQVGTTTTDAAGNFASSFLVPSLASGTYKVKVSDGINTDEADFTVLISANLNPTTSQASPGHVGTKLTISGVGFKPNGTVTINYDDTQVATAATSSSGTFSITFSAPSSIKGPHKITATDDINTQEFSFVMESEAPPAPVPLVPETGTKAKAEAYFNWEGVTDPSGVTYVFQISSNTDFDNMVLIKPGLTDSEYTVTEEEKLASVGKKEPYYWRVKAIDGASNESAWSEAWSFRIGFVFSMPSWVIYLLFGLGALLCGVLGFWLGKRTAYSSY